MSYALIKIMAFSGVILTTGVAGAADALVDRIVKVENTWGRLGVNSAVVPAHGSPMPLQIKGQKYAKGLGHQANGEIVLDLAGEVEAFEAEIGVQWQGGQTIASVVFQVFVDNEERFRSEVMTDESDPERIRIPLQGAKQLRLVVSDAGDGILYDSGNWAHAKLIFAGDAENRGERQIRLESRIDMAQFAKVVAWDQERLSGTAAQRFELPSADDLYPYQELQANDSGVIETPVSENGVSCIGLRWDTLQFISAVTMQFKEDVDVPPLSNVHLQVWQGESPWQGKWEDISQPIVCSGNRLKCHLGPTAIQNGTEKIRWIITDVEESLLVESISAFNQQEFQTVSLRVESLSSDIRTPCSVEIINGLIVHDKGCELRELTWDTSEPLVLSLRYNLPTPHKGDRTVLVFDVPEGSFGVAIEDVLTEQAVYVPHAGMFVTLAKSSITYNQYKEAKIDARTVLERVRERPDQTFQQAMEQVHLPAQDMGPMLVSLANDNRKFIAHQNGMISFQLGKQPDDANYRIPSTFQVGQHDPAALDCVQLQPVFANGEAGEWRRRLAKSWLPAPKVSFKSGGVQYRQTTFVVPLDESSPSNSPHWQRLRATCLNEFEMENTSSATADVSLALRLMENAKNDVKAEWQPVETGAIVSLNGRLVAFLEVYQSGSLELEFMDGEAVLRGRLRPGEIVACKVHLPAWELSPEEYRTLSGSQNWFAMFEGYWKEVMAGSMQIELPSELLTDVIKASRVHIMLAARNEKAGSLVAAWAASDRYGEIDSESHAVLRGMDMMGHHDFARRGLDHISNLFKPTGELTKGYTLVGTGEHLSTVAEYFQRTGDRDYVEKHLGEIVNACHWIIENRKTTKRYDQEGEKLPEYGLMPPGVSADWTRFAYRFYNDANYCAGLREAGKLLTHFEHPEAKTILEDAEEYSRDIVRAYRWAQSRSPVVSLDNGDWVPHYPSMLHTFGRVKEFFPGEDGNRSFCYDIELGAHHLAANHILPAEGRDAAWIMNHMEDVQFLYSGFGAYPEEENRENWFHLGGFGKLQPFYTRAEDIYAIHDDVKPFIRAYFNSLSSLLNTENLSLWEHFNHVAAWNKTHETGWLLAQTRTMLVLERGEDLWLAPFVTDQWTQDGMKIDVRNAPTRFGPVDFEIISHVADGSIEATIIPPTRRAPKQIVLRIRHPDGQRMRSVLVDGLPHEDFDASLDTVALRPTRRAISVRVEY